MDDVPSQKPPFFIGIFHGYVSHNQMVLSMIPTFLFLGGCEPRRHALRHDQMLDKHVYRDQLYQQPLVSFLTKNGGVTMGIYGKYMGNHKFHGILLIPFEMIRKHVSKSTFLQSMSQNQAASSSINQPSDIEAQLSGPRPSRRWLGWAHKHRRCQRVGPKSKPDMDQIWCCCLLLQISIDKSGTNGIIWSF